MQPLKVYLIHSKPPKTNMRVHFDGFGNGIKVAWNNSIFWIISMTTLTAKWTASSLTHVSHVSQWWFSCSSSSCSIFTDNTWPSSWITEEMRSRGCSVLEALMAITVGSQGNIMPAWSASGRIQIMCRTSCNSPTAFRSAWTISITNFSLLLQGHNDLVKARVLPWSRWYSMEHRPSTSKINSFHSGNTSPLLTTYSSKAKQDMAKWQVNDKQALIRTIAVCSTRRLLTEWIAFGGKMDLPSNHWRLGFRRSRTRLVFLIATSGQVWWLRDGCPSPHDFRKLYWESLSLKTADWSRLLASVTAVSWIMSVARGYGVGLTQHHSCIFWQIISILWNLTDPYLISKTFQHVDGMATGNGNRASQGLTVQIALPSTCRFWHDNIEPCLIPENLHQIFSFWSHLKANCM